MSRFEFRTGIYDYGDVPQNVDAYLLFSRMYRFWEKNLGEEPNAVRKLQSNPENMIAPIADSLGEEQQSRPRRKRLDQGQIDNIVADSLINVVFQKQMENSRLIEELAGQNIALDGLRRVLLESNETKGE